MPYGLSAAASCSAPQPAVDLGAQFGEPVDDGLGPHLAAFADRDDGEDVVEQGVAAGAGFGLVADGVAGEGAGRLPQRRGRGR